MDAVGGRRITILQVMQRRRFLKLSLGAAVATLVVTLAMEMVMGAAILASLTVKPQSGQAAASFSADGQYYVACKAGTTGPLAYFYWDYPAYKTSLPLQVRVPMTCFVAPTGASYWEAAITVKQAPTTDNKPGTYFLEVDIWNNGQQVAAAQSQYIIDPPPQPPTTPPPTTPPTTTPPPTTPPATTPPVAAPPATTPPAIASPSPSPTPCPVASATPARPGGTDPGWIIALVLSGGLPIRTLFAMCRSLTRRRSVSRVVSGLVVVVLLGATAACGRSCSNPSANALPTPTVSLGMPTPSC